MCASDETRTIQTHARRCKFRDAGNLARHSIGASFGALPKFGDTIHITLP